MASDTPRDERYEDERDARHTSLRERRARRHDDSTEDDYVDWSQTNRFGARKRAKRSNVLAFGVPFVLASLGLLWFALHGRDNSIARYAQQSAAERADARRTAQETKANAQADPADSEENILEQDRGDQNDEATPRGYRFVSHKNPQLNEAEVSEILAPELDDNGVAEPTGEQTIAEENPELETAPARTYNLPTFANGALKARVAEENANPDALEDGAIMHDLESGDATEPNSPLDDEDASNELPDEQDALPEFDAYETNLDAAATNEPEPELALEPAWTHVTEPATEPAAEPASEVVSDELEPIEPTSLEDGDDTLATDLELPEEPVAPLGPTQEELDAIRAEITQLEFAVEKIKERDLRDPDEAIEALEAPLDDARRLEQDAPEQLREDARRAREQVERFYEFLSTNAEFLRRLETLDDAVMTHDGARAFFAPYLEPNAPANDAQAPEIAQFESELARVAQTLEPLRAVDAWNAFVDANGAKLEKFHVDEQTAQNALNFIQENAANAAIPHEIAILQKREPEWRYDVEHKIATQRKVFIALDKEYSQVYWTYAPSTTEFYYLAAPPQPGVNVYSSNESGAPRHVRIPPTAKEIGLEESPQRTQLAELEALSRKIPDDMREKDPAQWYALWCQLLTQTLESERLDPILQYSLVKEIGEILAASDYRFERRLAPLLKVLNAPQLATKGKIDRFQSDSEEIKSLRALAASRLKYVPADHLVVNKTTEQLDAQVEACAFRYQRVGWLDRDYAGEPKLRRGNNVEPPTGELWVYAPNADQASWRKIGELNGEQVNLTIASDAIPRGSIVFCRTHLRATNAVARRSVEDAVFRR